jgi:hypothetical protein
VEQLAPITLALNLAIGGLLSSLLLLAVEYFGGSRRSSLVALALALASLLAATGVHFAGFGYEWSLAHATLAVVALSSVAIRSSYVRQGFDRLVQPVSLWCLALAGSVAAAFFVIWGTGPVTDLNDLSTQSAVAFRFVPTVVAITDTGRELPLCAYDDSDTLLHEERNIINLEQYAHQIIRLAEPSARANCHGWVYFGGQYAVRSRDVSSILSDNGYSTVAEPTAGDLAIYRAESDEITHTALVRIVREDGSVVCESKWGPLGVYLHPVAVQPYGSHIKYYRSERGDHRVTVVPATSRPAEESPLALAAGPLDPLPLLSATRVKPTRRPIYERPAVRVPGQRKT